MSCSWRLATRGSRSIDISDPADPVQLNTVSTVGGMAGVESDGFGNVVTLEGRVGQHVVLRLWALQDLIDGGGANHLAEEALSPPLTNVGPGDLELEVFADSLDFTAAEPPAGDITVVPDAGGSWKSLTVSAGLLAPNHPVLLVDAVSGRVLWSGRAPAEGPLTHRQRIQIFPISRSSTRSGCARTSTPWCGRTQRPAR